MKKAEVRRKLSSTVNYALIRALLEEADVHCDSYYCARRPQYRISCQRCCARARAIIRVVRAHVV